ncbi:hypothetical protein Poli38472_007499 [Pythium oligandrum]|uniref:SWIM-type domain-containing protein n=1 Tax=Pythium oligandrum TaxID=41045 RepID=A0A8K1CSA6_PYTOL|nr:hypothetical protein Poli38472_007499 [Pythium oligandrum]|eukprot:TMW67827.1 hypothetical protein Poli38472_007499 [Pythium oligandrum]
MATMTPTSTSTAVETDTTQDTTSSVAVSKRGVDARSNEVLAVENESAEVRALKTLKWKTGRELTAYVQDLALQHGKRALVATSGGSFKKFVCSSETRCPWLINAVCTRPRQRKTKTTALSGETDTRESEEDVAKRRYWYVSSAYLVHANCTGMAKPTVRQLKESSVLKQAVLTDAKVSSVQLMEQLKTQERLLCTKSMVYKAKVDMLDSLDTITTGSEDGTDPLAGSSVPVHPDLLRSTQLLPSYLSRLQELNPETLLQCTERDPASANHLWRAMMALRPERLYSTGKPPLVFGIDSVPVKPTPARPCTELICVGCDSNLSPMTLAVALVPEPNELHSLWFLQKLIDFGFPLQRAHVVFTDGRWPMTSACARAGVQCMLQDTRYVIQDVLKSMEHHFPTPASTRPGLASALDHLLRQDQVAAIWAAQNAGTEGEFYAALHGLETSGGSLSANAPTRTSGAFAAQHLRNIDPRRWALFPHMGSSRFYGWQTTRFSPSDQGRAISMSPPPQTQLPCEFFKMMALSLTQEMYQRHEFATQWAAEQRVVTVEAERMMQEEMKLVPMYNVAMSAPHIAFVWNPQGNAQIRQQRVDLQAKTCTCSVRQQFGIPCRHILSVLRKLNTLGQSFEYFDESYLVQNYVATHQGRRLELPLDESIHPDASWMPLRNMIPVIEPPVTQVRAIVPVISTVSTKASSTSATKKRRIRNRPEDARKRAMYKCRKCGIADGHNSLTCTNQRGRVV